MVFKGKKGWIKMFSLDDLQIIDESHNGDFKDIRSFNDNGSINIDVFILYKIEDNSYCVEENDNTLYVGRLQSCLSYIHKWL